MTKGCLFRFTIPLINTEKGQHSCCEKAANFLVVEVLNVVVMFVEFEEVNTCVGGPSTPAPH